MKPDVCRRCKHALRGIHHVLCGHPAMHVVQSWRHESRALTWRLTRPPAVEELPFETCSRFEEQGGDE